MKTGAALSGDAIAKLIQSRCRKAKIAGDFSGHSMRRGAIQTLNEQGLTTADIQQLSRQKTAAMVTIYCENNDKRRLARKLKFGL